MKKISIVLFVAVVILSMLVSAASCKKVATTTTAETTIGETTAEETTAEETTAEEITALEKPVDIAIWYIEREYWPDYMKQVVEHFAPMGINIRPEPKPLDTWDEIKSAAGMAKSGPDIVMDWVGYSAEIVEGRAGSYMRLNEILTDEFKNNINAEWYPDRLDGSLYGIPYSIKTDPMMYNKDLLSKAGVDTSDWPKRMSWDEFINVCAKLKEAGIIPIQWTNEEGWNGEIWWSLASYTNFDSSEEYTQFYQDKSMNDPLFFDMLEKLKFLYDKGYLYPGGGTLSYTDQHYKQLANGEVAISVGSAGDIKYAIENLPGFEEKIGLSFYPKWSEEGDLARQKVIPTYGDGFSITTWCKNKDIALRVIKELAITQWGANLFFNATNQRPAYKGVDLVYPYKFQEDYFSEEQKNYKGCVFGYSVWPKEWCDDWWKFNQSYLDGYITKEELADGLDNVRGIK